MVYFFSMKKILSILSLVLVSGCGLENPEPQAAAGASSGDVPEPTVGPCFASQPWQESQVKDCNTLAEHTLPFLCELSEGAPYAPPHGECQPLPYAPFPSEDGGTQALYCCCFNGGMPCNF
jgi:hypothetical protein